MATLTVWQFSTVDGADRAVPLLERLAIDDAAIVEWAVGDRKPRSRQLIDGGMDIGFWGLLLGLVFFVPLLGAAMGATTGALAGALTDVGIDDHFMNRVRDQVTPGTSALFLIGAGPDVDPLHEVLAAAGRPEVITTDLDPAQEAALRTVFAD